MIKVSAAGPTRRGGAETAERVDGVSDPPYAAHRGRFRLISSDPKLRQETIMATKRAPVTMYDAVTPDNIPDSAEVVAGYIDGDYAWPRDAWNRWPDAQKVLITTNGSLIGNVADVENGNMTPDQAGKWIEDKQREGRHGCTVYCSLGNLETVLAGCRGHAYYVWVADWTGEPHTIRGAIATQYSCVDNLYDLSRVYSQDWLNLVGEANDPWPIK
jgi:hypothetical protein